jgi:hypothetical protein
MFDLVIQGVPGGIHREGGAPVRWSRFSPSAWRVSVLSTILSMSFALRMDQLQDLAGGIAGGDGEGLVGVSAIRRF